MSIMGMNPYFAQATLNFGMHNHLVTAMAIAQGINLVNQTTSSPLIPASNSPLPPFSNLSIPRTSNQSLFPTTALPASSTQCLCGLVPFPKFPWFFFPYDGWKTIICKLLQKCLYGMFLIRKKQKIENKTYAQCDLIYLDLELTNLF